jgi:AraC-like DNA-binding protein
MYVLGMNTEHAADFVVDRRNGSGYWLFMCFSSRFTIRTADGLEQGEPGDCILHDPSFPQYHAGARNADSGFVNSWFHCSGTGIRSMVERYGLPLNTLIRTRQPHLFDRTLAEIETERLRKLPYSRESIQLGFERLLLEIARHRPADPRNPPASTRHREALERVRALMSGDSASTWTVEALARKARMSPARFAQTYTLTFGVSPIDDLIGMRLQEAQTALLSTDRRIEDIAIDCGFSSPSYFSRVFKARTGVSPRAFRG